MSFQTISLAKEGPIATIALDSPDNGNLINKRMVQDLSEACEELANNENIRAIILTGDDNGTFSLGWDNSFLENITKVPTDIFGPIAALPQPTICAINGDAISAGVELALCCDIRIASNKAHFCFTETSNGMIPIGGGTQRLPRIVGLSWALSMILTGKSLSSKEALSIGLITHTASQSTLEKQAQKIALTIAQRGPIAVRYAKEAIAQGVDMSLQQGMNLELDLSVILQTTKDRQEGLDAFLDKREPKFLGH